MLPIIANLLLWIVLPVCAGTHYYFEGINRVQDEVIAVSGSDTVTIRACTLTVNGNIYVNQGGVLNFEGDTLILNANLYAWDNARIRFNRCRILWNSTYVYQYGFVLAGGAHVSMDSSFLRMPYNAGMSAKDSSFFSSVATVFDGSWTKSADNRSRMTFTDCVHPFEFLINDSASLSFTRCTDVLTWLYLPKGSHGTLSLPGDTNFRYVDTFYLGPHSDSLHGIPYSVTMDSTTNIWGCIPQAGCSVTVADSKLRVLGLIFMDSAKPYELRRLNNNTYFDNTLLPIFDRTVTLKNTYVRTFNLYPMLNAFLRLDSSLVGEIISYHQSRMELHSVTVDGSGGFFGLEGGSKASVDQSIFSCVIKVKDSAALRLTASYAPYSTTVLNQGCFLSANTVTSASPDLRDSSRFVSVNLKTPDNFDTLHLQEPVVADVRSLSGPGINPFPLNVYSFAVNLADTSSILLAPLAPFTHDTVAIWNTEALSPAPYYLFMPVIIGTDTLTAIRLVYKSAGTPVQPNPVLRDFGVGVWPNPFSSAVTLDFGAASSVHGLKGVSLRILDVMGNRIRCIDNPAGSRFLQWDGRNKAGSLIASGTYILQIQQPDGKVVNRKLMRVR